MSELIYLNNAGTSWPKPASVTEAVQAFYAQSPMAWGASFPEAHAEVCDFFGIQDATRFLLTPGCTSALALALSELPWEAGDIFLTSTHEHHGLGRWSTILAQTRGVVHRTFSIDAGDAQTLSEAQAILETGKVRLLACTMASNVTGALLPAKDLVALAHRYGALCLLDGAQAAGIIPIDLASLGADLFTFAGHKGTLAPQGIGGLYVAPCVTMTSPPALCALPGPNQPPPPCTGMPSYCDLGSVNMAALAGLNAGIRWLQERGLETHRRALVETCARLLDGLQQLPGVTIYGPHNANDRTSAISIRLQGTSVTELGRKLREDFGIIASAGHQCAPMAHDALGTPQEGTLRLSTGPFTQTHEIDTALHAINTIQHKN